MTYQTIQVESGGVMCAGRLILPSRRPGDERPPSIVMAHGLSGTMDRLFPLAERFAESGIAALVFDYRSFGESGGEPRQVVDLSDQQDDIRAAVSWLRASGSVDAKKVALWGNSLGGAHVITVAAGDPQVDAVVSQIPFNGFPRETGRSTGDSIRLMATILWDALRGQLGASPAYIPMIAGPGEVAVVTSGEAERHLLTLTGGESDTLWRNQIAPRGLLQMMRYRPAEDAARLQAPLLVSMAEDDQQTPPHLTRALAAAAPNATLLEYPGSHFDFYSDSETRDRAVADQVAFLQAHLGVTVEAS